MENFYHLITTEELEKFPNVFPVDTMEGQRMALTPQQYEAIGLELHSLDEGDIATNPHYANLGLKAGDIIERKIPEININEEEENLEPQ